MSITIVCVSVSAASYSLRYSEDMELLLSDFQSATDIPSDSLTDGTMLSNDSIEQMRRKIIKITHGMKQTILLLCRLLYLLADVCSIILAPILCRILYISLFFRYSVNILI